MYSGFPKLWRNGAAPRYFFSSKFKKIEHGNIVFDKF